MTAGGPNEYGDDSPTNRFKDPATGEAYFVIVDKKTGKTKIYNEEFGADKYIGEYDPKTGKTYSGMITLKDNNTLDLRGYVGISLLGRTSTCTRAK